MSHVSIFFNSTFYLQNNPDVLQAVAEGSMPSAEFHFNEYGYKEGRAPNAYFDVNYYLINNPDVLLAGVNPLTHFIQFGAAEGRMPSAVFVAFADFDTETYAAANPDLAAARLVTASQLYAHFATYGFGENRPGVQTVDGTPIEVGVPGGEMGRTDTLDGQLNQFIGTDLNDLYQGQTSDIDPFDSINGGAGTDTLNLIGEFALASTAGVTITNVEIVNLSGNTGAVDASVFGSAQQFQQIGSAGASTNVGAGTTAGFRDTATNSVGFVAAATSASIALDNVDNASVLNVDGINLTTLTVSGSVASAGAGAPGNLTLTTTGEDTTTAANDGSNIANVTLNLTSNTIIDLNDLLATEDFVTLDASGSTGGIEVTTDNWGDNFLSTVLTGTGDDKIYFDQDYSGGGFGGDIVTIDAGAGDDEVSYAAYNNPEATTASITLGEGNDLFSVVEQFQNVVSASEANFADSLITVEDFNVDEDVFDISAMFLVMETFINTELAAISAASSLFDALEVAASFIAPSNFGVFNYGADAYILSEASGDGTFSNGDGLIKLAGVSALDLDASNFVA